MSYDLMVFEKGKAPAAPSDFQDWYAQKMEEGDEQDISCISEKLQNFFHSLRQIFPPMNGPYASEDQELSENPAMEERLCDYSILEDMIYLSFSYSVSELACNTVKQAAYFAGVGFFNPSDDNSVPLLFESRCPMLLEGQWFRPMEIDDFDSIREKLSGMTVKNHSYLYVTDQVGNYIQIGGYGDSFTVERRIYSGPGAYVHAKAGYAGNGVLSDAGEVIIAGNPVRVGQNQILPKAVAQQLFQDFFQGQDTAHSIEWEEMDL